MKTIASSSPVSDPRWIDEDHHQLRTLCLADGKSVTAQVTKVEKDGVQITSPETTGFINASELCTVDRVHYGFGTRKEDAWVAQMNANEAKQKSGRPTHALHV